MELQDPTQARDPAELLEDNLELLLVNSEMHEHVEESLRGKREMDFVKGLAKQMMLNAEGKAKEKRMMQLRKM